MPWCEDCSKFWNPPSLASDGSCPTCQKVIAKPPKSAPWHFKVLVVGVTVYMIYRIYWLVEWLPHHL